MPKKDPKLVSLAKSLGELYSSDEEKIFNTDNIIIDYCLDQLNSFTDDRQEWKIKYQFSHVVMIVVLCCFAKINEWKEMEHFATRHEADFKKLLNMETGIPSHDTLEDVIAIIKPNELINMLVPLFISVVDNGIKTLGIEAKPLYKDCDDEINDIIAFDGKVIKGSGQRYKKDEDLANYNSLNVFSTEYQISLCQERISNKTNEITAMPTIIKLLNLKNTIATFDALNTQKDVIKEIVAAKGDYVAVLKKNHENFYEELEEYFNDTEFLEKIKNQDAYLEETSKTKRKQVRREYYITEDVNWFSEKNLWDKLKSFGYEVKTSIDLDTKVEVIEKRYFLTSLKQNVSLFALAVRRHWNIENNLHWHLDVTFKEDDLRTKNKNALENLSIINRFVLAVLGLVKETFPKLSYNYIRSDISWDLLGGMTKIFKTLSYLRENKNI